MKVTFTDALIKGCSGKLDNNSEFYFRYNKRTGTTSLCRRPHRKTTTMNPNQTAQQKRFRRMVEIRREILSDKKLSQKYEKMWQKSQRKKYERFRDFVSHKAYEIAKREEV